MGFRRKPLPILSHYYTRIPLRHYTIILLYYHTSTILYYCTIILSYYILLLLFTVVIIILLLFRGLLVNPCTHPSISWASEIASAHQGLHVHDRGSTGFAYG